MEPTVLIEPSTSERLWKEYADRLLLFANAILFDATAAEDVLQNVFTRLIANGPPEGAREAGYLFRAVRNEALNTLRSRRTEARVRGLLFDRDRSSVPYSGLIQAEFAGQVEEAIRELPPKQRDAVVLKIWGDLSFKEAAEVVGTTSKALEHNYYCALSALETGRTAKREMRRRSKPLNRGFDRISAREIGCRSARTGAISTESPWASVTARAIPTMLFTVPVW